MYNVFRIMCHQTTIYRKDNNYIVTFSYIINKIILTKLFYVGHEMVSSINLSLVLVRKTYLLVQLLELKLSPIKI